MLRMKNCRARYGERTVLENVTLDVPTGCVTALIGPNGSGKSTLLRMAARLIRPETGEMYLEGKDAFTYTRRAYAQKVAFMPQSRDVPALTARALAAHGRYPHMQFPRVMTVRDAAIVEDALDRAGALPYADRDVRALSGGERQRAYLAMAMAQEGKLLLLDEPATYLDAGCAFALLGRLRAYAQAGNAVFVALHDIAHALTFADSVVVLCSGRLVAHKPPASLSPALVESVFGVRLIWTTLPSGENQPIILPKP